jgi:hypothetical protein
MDGAESFSFPTVPEEAIAQFEEMIKLTLGQRLDADRTKLW